MILNLAAAATIMVSEIISNREFDKWFKENSFIASVITIFASADLSVLNILTSNFAEMKMLNFPFSEKAYKYIALTSFVGSLFRDVPKLIIQVSDFFF